MEVLSVDCGGLFFHSFTGSVGDAIFQEHKLIVEFKKDGAIAARSFVQAFLEATANVYGELWPKGKSTLNPLQFF